MLLHDLILEARKFPKLNTKRQPLAELIDIQRNTQSENVFVTFTDVDKLGINPSSTYDTPLGIYAYPLNYVIDVKMHVPFAAYTNYIQVFQLIQPDDVWWLRDQSQISEIKQKLAQVMKVPSNISDARKLWYFVYKYASSMGKPSIASRKLMMKAGIVGMVDYGTDDDAGGIIHENEPIQAVFFTTKVLKQLTTIDIRNRYRQESKARLLQFAQADIDKMSASEAYDYARLRGKGHRNSRLESRFLMNPLWSYQFAKLVLNGRFEPGEPAILNNAAFKKMYVELLKDLKIPIPSSFR
jgi:hypothetical protein